MFRFLRKKKLEENESDIEKKTYKESLSFFRWTQEYTKKIITITFSIYVIINLISISLIIITYFQTGELNIDTLIMEINLTFREVIGGYIIKAACENICKGIGVIIDKFIGNNNYNIDDTSSIYDCGEDCEDPELVQDCYEDKEESDLEPIKNPFINLKRKE